MSEWAWASWCAWMLVVVLGATLRSRAYAIFRGVVLALHTLIVLALLPHFGSLRGLALYFHLAVFVDSALLVRPSLRPGWYRVLLSWPAQYMAAATLLSFPWAIASAFGFEPRALLVPYVVAALGMVQSLRSKVDYRELRVGNVAELRELVRVPGRVSEPALGSAPAAGEPVMRPLRIAQITDPHLGPFMSIARLRRICQRLVDEDPDLVLLTGDFLTMESQREARWLAEALEPLDALSGRVFGCMGNHDHEAPGTVARAFSKIGAGLLVDDAVEVETPAGRVQVIGFDFHFRDSAKKMAEVCARYPREAGVFRLALLHNPGAFKHLRSGEADLVLSGHTHGGQVGLVSFGLNWTVAGALAKIPDHGLWGLGTNRMYIHRGTGHYGFPLRLGVPGEQSVLSVWRA